MSLLALIKGTRGASGFGFASTAEDVTAGIDLSGKVALVTGANSGLGKETARVLALRGAHVLTVARSMDKAVAAAEALPKATPIACELSEPSSVQAAVASVRALGMPIDILVCNAGIMALPKLEQKYGYELQFFTNHIGHFILTTGLLESLSEEARVVVLSSYGHKLASKGIELDNLSGEANYAAWRAYGRSKLCNLLFAVELARRFEGTGRTANAVHPGVIRTNLGRHMHPAVNFMYAATDVFFTKNEAQGAATSCFVASHPSLRAVSGNYFADSNVARASGYGRDAQLAKDLWQASEAIAKKFETKAS